MAKFSFVIFGNRNLITGGYYLLFLTVNMLAMSVIFEKMAFSGDFTLILHENLHIFFSFQKPRKTGNILVIKAVFKNFAA